MAKEDAVDDTLRQLEEQRAELDAAEACASAGSGRGRPHQEHRRRLETGGNRRTRATASWPTRPCTPIPFPRLVLQAASVPEDAQPPDRRRRAFQFYMGPDREQLDPIIPARLPPDRQRAWTRRVKHEERSALRKAAAGRPS